LFADEIDCSICAQGELLAATIIPRNLIWSTFLIAISLCITSRGFLDGLNERCKSLHSISSSEIISKQTRKKLSAFWKSSQLSSFKSCRFDVQRLNKVGLGRPLCLTLYYNSR